MLYYDAASGGFYDTDVHAEIPQAAQPITRLEHAALLAAQSQGKTIVPDADGRPCAVPPPPATPAERLDRLRHARDALLRASDKTQLPDYPLAPEQRAAVASWRQALRDLPQQGPDASIPPAPFPI